MPHYSDFSGINSELRLWLPFNECHPQSAMTNGDVHALHDIVNNYRMEANWIAGGASDVWAVKDIGPMFSADQSWYSVPESDDGSNFWNPTSFTLMAWVTVEEITSSNANLFSKQTATTGFALRRDVADLEFFLADGAAFSSIVHTFSAGDANNETVFCVAATYDGTTARLYVDGAESSNAADSFSAATAQPLTLFHQSNNAGQRHWRGHVGGMKMWGRCLEPGEILDHTYDPTLGSIWHEASQGFSITEGQPFAKRWGGVPHVHGITGSRSNW